MPNCFSPEERLDFLQRFGSHCMAYSTLQPRMEYFDDPRTGYLAFLAVRHPVLAPFGTSVVLSDPIADPRHWGKLLGDFLSQQRNAIFLQIGERCADLMFREFGMKINEMGIEHEIHLPAFSLGGKSKAQLRHWLNKARKEGVEITETPIEQMDLAEVQAVSDEWLRSKSGEEARLLTRPLVLSNERDVRYFWASKDGRLLAFIVFDPLYRGRQIIGYYHNLVRVVEAAPHGTTDLATIAAMDRFREEGVDCLSLGMSPLCQINDDGIFPHGRLLKRLLKLMYDRANFIYPFQGSYFHKRKYGTNTKKVYIATTRGNSPWDALVVLHALGLRVLPRLRTCWSRRKTILTQDQGN